MERGSYFLFLQEQIKDTIVFLLIFCVHFLNFSLPPIVEVDIYDFEDIAIISGITNMVKAVILEIHSTPQKIYRIAQYTVAQCRLQS